MPALVVSAGGSETRHPLADRTVVVGRSVECDIQLDDERSSRKHLRIEPTDRGWRLVDMESSNGTALNGYAVAQALLAPGDVVEVGDVEIRFEGDGPQQPRAPRPPRPKRSAGLAWVGAIVAAAVAVVVTDNVVVGSVGDRETRVRDALDRGTHAEFLLATADPDPARIEAGLAEFLARNPAAADAGAARSRLEAVRAGRASREAAAAEWESLRSVAATLDPGELRWRTDRLVRRWSDDAGALAELRRRMAEGASPAAGTEGDPRVLFAKRKREADAAVDRGEYGRALALWEAHAAAFPPATAADEANLRAEIRRVEDSAAGKAADVLQRAAALEKEGKAPEADAAVREAAAPLEGTSGGRRLRARLDRGASPAGGAAGAPSRGAAAKAGPGGKDEGYARRRALLLRMREAEQFVALRAYDEALRRTEAIAAEAGDLSDLRADMQARGASLRRVAGLLGVVRAKDPARLAAPDTASAAELHGLLVKHRRHAADWLAIADFDYDQGLRKEAVAAVAAALGDRSTQDGAGRLYAAREGLPFPEGGFVAEKGEVLTRPEMSRRHNAAAIVERQKRQDLLLKRLRETALVKGIEKMAGLRAELDRRRAYALDLIFDEVKYFYPYRDRMKEYAPVSREVDERVKAVREVWEAKISFKTRVEGPAAQILKDLDAAAKELRDLGAEPTARDAELDVLRGYFDRDLTVQGYFVGPEDLEQQQFNAAILAENAKRQSRATADERKQVEITNLYRVMLGRNVLNLEDHLVMAARGHSEDMVKLGFFDHFNPFDPKKHGPDDRIRLAGYEPMACSENIHAGRGDPEGAHEGWTHSSGHHRNLLNSAWKDMGTGRSGNTWTQNFGLPQSAYDDPDAGGPGRWDRAGGRGDGGDGNDPPPPGDDGK